MVDRLSLPHPRQRRAGDDASRGDGAALDCRHAGADHLDNQRNQRCWLRGRQRSEEHTSELQSLMRISYAVFCLKKKTTYKHIKTAYIKIITTKIYIQQSQRQE